MNSPVWLQFLSKSSTGDLGFAQGVLLPVCAEPICQHVWQDEPYPRSQLGYREISPLFLVHFGVPWLGRPWQGDLVALCQLSKSK